MLHYIFVAAVAAQAGPMAFEDHAAVIEAARAALAAKCTQCHGSDLSHPKAGFGFVTDLGRLAGSPDFVVPGNPDASELWKQIDEGDMPPDSAKAGPLTDYEKAAIRRWIEAGAPSPPESQQPSVNRMIVSVDESNSLSGQSSESSSAIKTSQRPPETTASSLARAIEFIGRLHVIAVHFPIGLLIAAGIAEFWTRLQRETVPHPTVRFCLWLGAMSTVVAAGLGWLHALGDSGGLNTIIGVHRWMGTLVGVLAPVVALMAERDARCGTRHPLTRGSIFVLAAIVGLAGHFGGLLTHGTGFLTP